MRIGVGTALRSVLAVALRPRLWATAVIELFLLARPRWWRRWPPIPAPDPAYLRFRMHTAYGDGSPPADPSGDIVDYLDWCRRMRRIGR